MARKLIQVTEYNRLASVQTPVTILSKTLVSYGLEGRYPVHAEDLRTSACPRCDIRSDEEAKRFCKRTKIISNVPFLTQFFSSFFLSLRIKILRECFLFQRFNLKLKSRLSYVRIPHCFSDFREKSWPWKKKQTKQFTVKNVPVLVVTVFFLSFFFEKKLKNSCFFLISKKLLKKKFF